STLPLFPSTTLFRSCASALYLRSIAKSSRPVSARREPDKGWVLCVAPGASQSFALRRAPPPRPARVLPALADLAPYAPGARHARSEEHTSELQSLTN